ncbi:MAG: phosphoribosylamine--glycine ligase [Micavibrio sp.]|nr:phosphoribosylamine--glycine ligase [Micavibrio sp.]
MSNVRTVLLLGAGGREHALAWKMAQSASLDNVYAMPGNDGMAALAKVTCLAGDPADTNTVLAAIEKTGAGLVVIGPEKPLDAGVVDALEARQIPVMGPRRAAAQLESSKIFAKEFMTSVGIPTAGYAVCDSHAAALEALKGWNVDGEGVVIKADGLAAGKGVVVTHDRAEAERTAYDFMVNPDCSVKSSRLLLEKKLKGKEVSAFALCDGETFVTLGFVCDYKRVRDGDEGPNTGGMGGYAPQDWPSPAARQFVQDHIFRAVVDGMKKRGQPFRGVLFAGLMIDGEDVNVIEFNTRFGDPETQILMPLLEADVLPLFLQAATGTLALAAPVHLKNTAAVHVVMASEGYPETLGTGMTLGQGIDLPEALLQQGGNDNGFLFIMGAKKSADGWTNAGGRVLGITALGDTIDAARQKAYDTIGRIRFKGAHWRRDIGR